MTALPLEWRRTLPGFVLGVVLVMTLYFASGAAMVEIWNRSETFAHAYLVPVISGWLVWRRRAELAQMNPAPSPRWLLALIPLGLLWLLGELAAVNAATQFAFMGMLVALVPAMMGTQVAGRIAFALGFLFFAVPFGDFLTPWLMDATADFTVAALRAVGVPVYREALQFVIPTGSWSVVQACSGIRYLMASLMVGTLFAYLNFGSHRKRWAFVAVSIITPLVANWLRAFMIVMLGHLSDNRIATGVDHLIYGWVFFGIVMLAMFMIGSRWSDADPQHVSSPIQPRAGASTRSLVVSAMAAVLLLAGPHALWLRADQAATTAKPALSAPDIASWRVVEKPLSNWTPAFDQPAAQWHGQLESAASPVPIGLYVAYYRHQHFGSKLVSSTNQLVNAETSKDWAQVSSGTADAASLQWRTAELRGEAMSALSAGSPLSPRLSVWQIYWVNGRAFDSDWQAKLYGAWAQLLGHGDDAAVVIVYTRKTDAVRSDAVIREFLDRHWVAIDTWMKGVRERGRQAQR